MTDRIIHNLDARFESIAKESDGVGQCKKLLVEIRDEEADYWHEKPFNDLTPAKKLDVEQHISIALLCQRYGQSQNKRKGVGVALQAFCDAVRPDGEEVAS